MAKRIEQQAQAAELIEQLALALDDEVAAVTAADQGRVSAVVRLIDRGPVPRRNTRRMVLECATAIDTGRNGYIMTQAPGEPICRGRVVELADRGREVTADFYDRVPMPHPALTVQRDSAWLPRSMADRLRQAAAPTPGVPSPFDITMAVAPLGLEADGPHPTAPVPYPHEIREGGGVRLDDYQVEAIRVAMARRLTFIAGFPGAGKTVTLGRLASQLAQLAAQAHETVLVVTPSNVATDIVLMAVAADLRGHPAWTAGLVRRVGQNTTSELTAEVAAHVLPDEQERRLGVLPPGCRVVVTTTAQLHLADGVWRAFDTVIIDEASMVSPPAVALAAGLARQRVVVAGDPCQLPPVVVADTPRARAYLTRDAFRMSGVYPRYLDGDVENVVVLKQQYRYPAELARFIGALAYRDQIVTAPRDVHGVRALPLLFIDTSEANARVGSGKRVNVVHAELVREIVARLGPDQAARSGILTLYRDQVAMIGAKLRRAGLRVDSVGTVHGAQGQTHEHTTIIDLADAPDRHSLPFLGDEDEGLGLRLTAVACSRPRESLVLIGHVQWLRERGNADVRRLLDLVAEHGIIVTADELWAADPAIALASDAGVERRAG